MLLVGLLTYHLAYQSGPIAVSVNAQAVAVRDGTAAVTGGQVTIDNGSRHFTIDLAKLMSLATHHIAMLKDANGACGLLQPLAVSSHYVAVEAVWAEKGCRPAAYFIDADSGAIVETVDIDHRWDHQLDVQPARFEGQPIRVEHVDHAMLALAHYDRSGMRIDARLPWYFAIVRGRDSNGNLRLYAYDYGPMKYGTIRDPGWNIFPSPGSIVEVGPLKGLFPYSYHPDPDVLRLSAADDARYAERQEPISPHYARAIQRGQWLDVTENDVQALQFSQALGAFATMLSFEDDQSLYSSEKAMYERCRAMVAQVQAGKMSAASARSLWSKGCRT
jgi:hypothetical protein